MRTCLVARCLGCRRRRPGRPSRKSGLVICGPHVVGGYPGGDPSRRRRQATSLHSAIDDGLPGSYGKRFSDP